MRCQKWSNGVKLFSCPFSGKIQIETRNAKFEVTGVVQGKSSGAAIGGEKGTTLASDKLQIIFDGQTLQARLVSLRVFFCADD